MKLRTVDQILDYKEETLLVSKTIKVDKMEDRLLMNRKLSKIL